MEQLRALGRVAVVARGEEARRALRTARALVRDGRVSAVIALHAPADRDARFVREADESVARDSTWEDALRLASADSLWIGALAPAERIGIADAARRLDVALVGPDAAALHGLSDDGALARIAQELGCAVAGKPGPRTHLVEAAVARDRVGGVKAIAVGECSLRFDDGSALVESPSTALSVEDEQRIRELAERAARVAGWPGLVSVQFHVTDEGGPELSGIDTFPQSAAAMEAAYGLDLVLVALRLGAGDALADAADPHPKGHAVAARISVAWPPADEASRVRLELLRLPCGPDVHGSAALEQGDEIPRGTGTLATVAAVAERRSEALHRLEQALEDTDLLLRGAVTTKATLLALCDRAEVRSGDAAYGYVERLAASGERLVEERADDALLAAAIAAYESELDLERARFLTEARRGRPRVGPSSGRAIELRHDGRRYRLEVRQTSPDTYRVEAAAGAAEIHVDRLGALERRLTRGNRRLRVLSVSDGLRQDVQVDGVPHVILREPAGLVSSPMPAVVVAIAVAPGQRVDAGETIARIESMKVEVEVKAPEAGVVREVVATPNTQIDAGDPLVRIEPLGDATAAAGEPVSIAAAPTVSPGTPAARYVQALQELGRLLLGFDVPAADARRLGTHWRDLAAAAPPGDREVLAAEDWALRAFTEVQSLFSRVRPRGAEPGAKPALEEIWRFLHEPEKRGAGLAPAFVSMLERALSHYAVSLESPGRKLELALLRLQKAYERADDQVAPILGILDRRLTREGAEQGLSEADARELVERLADIGQERYPAIADLARELRYRRFDQPVLNREHARIYEQAESDLDGLSTAPAHEREAIVARLVACPHPIATLLIGRMASSPPRVRPLLVETLMRRYYRARPLERIEARSIEGLPCASAEFDHEGRRLHIVTCFAPASGAAAATRVLASMGAEVGADVDFTVELYLWEDQEPTAPDVRAAELQAMLAEAGFARAVRRASVVLALPGRGVGHEASQQHFTFRGEGPWSEDRRYRGVHPMLFRRMQLSRLSRFDLERLPSIEDVYLYRAVAQGNPKDERLFATAEVRDVMPIRDAAGAVIQLPNLERVLHEALAGMRRFQARRAPHQRLEWNRVMLTVTPPLDVTREEIRGLAERLAPATEGLGLEMIVIHATVPDEETGDHRETIIRVVTVEGSTVNIRWDPPIDRPLEPMAEYQQRVVQLRRRGLMHPFEIVRLLAPAAGSETGVPPGTFVEHDLDASGALVPVERPPGANAANMVVGVVSNFTDRHPDGMRRVILLGDPSRAMGSLAEPECRRISAAIDLAERMGVPLEWFAVSAGAKISMESGTENMDWISHVLRRIVNFTQRGGEINVVVVGINVGAQPYWNAEATMLMHTRGILVMTRGSAMVLTGKEALQYSGSVSAEDNEGIGGYDRIMGPNGQAQYWADGIPEAIEVLLRHYDHCWVAPGERFPRRAETRDPRDRDVRDSPHGPAGGAGFGTVGDVFSAEHNPDRKKPFDIRRVMAAAIDRDHPPLERWRDLRGGETAVTWDAHLGGWPVCLIGIESRPLPRLEFVPADGPDFWSAGTLFPNSSKKIARAINGASGNRPLVVLANLSGFDGSPESMRRLQLEYGAEIGRAVVNFDGPIVFCVVSRYHGGAFVVFSKTLREDIEVVAVEGARASVLGGAPAAAVVFARDVETRTRKDPRVQEAERAAGSSGAAKAHLADVIAAVRAEKVGEVAEEFDAIHTVERALRVGSLDRIIEPSQLRPYLIDAVERGMARHLPRAAEGSRT
ncbi:MAG TPA: carboxyl transferase domain-containing protein [Anaeromyxobacteraceae bacterium]|nr:carboxyl transferase domain-containing protein [Anaeromyxobacteraceae bacterium]